MLLTHEDAAISTEPDAAFATWATLESGRLRPVEKAERGDEYVELQGTPDIVVEIVSDSSERKDLVLLREGYAAAGVPEYWVIDARAEVVRFEILSLEEGVYRGRSSSAHAQRSDVLGLTFVLEREKNRIGRWSYRLRWQRIT
jgi:Uma2 family endonuclease